MPTGHFGLAQLEAEPDKVLAIAKSLGMERIYCPYVMPDDRPTDAAGWRAFGARLQKAGAPYRAAGLGFGWHNHDFEFERAARRQPARRTAIFDGGPDLEWEMDVAWVDPRRGRPAGLDREIRAPHHRGPCQGHRPRGRRTRTRTAGPMWARAPSTGPALMTALRATPCTHFVMEHDNPSDHARFATRSIARPAEGI